MSELGDVLALLLGAHERYSSIRATLKVRYSSSQRAQRLRQEHEAETDCWRQRPVMPRSREGLLWLWMAPPDRVREEHEGELGGWRVGIRNGGSWWALDEDGVAYSNEDEPEVDTDIGERTKQLFDPRPLAAALKLSVVGGTEVAGRGAIRVRATVREAQPGRQNLELLLAGEEFELDVDAERGVLLRRLARSGGAESSLEEVVEIAFDEDFPPQTFEPVPGAPAASAVESREIPLNEAAALAGFPVRALPPLAPGWSLHSSYFPGDERGREPEAVVLDLVYDDSRHIWIAQTAAGQHSQIESLRSWQPVRHEGRDAEVVRPEGGGFEAWLRFDVGGTHVVMSSRDFSVDDLLKLADGLQRS
jgi:hypothetical protein